MTIEFVEGDIFESPAQTIVNTVNCKGVMGKGLALKFKKKYPEMYQEYKKACDLGLLKIGMILPPYKASEQRWVINFPTKDHWRFKSKIKYIEEGLVSFSENYKDWGVTSIAFPRLGCQLGGLSWKDVEPLMVKYLANLPNLKVSVYSYQSPEKVSAKSTKTKRKKISSLNLPKSQQKL